MDTKSALYRSIAGLIGIFLFPSGLLGGLGGLLAITSAPAQALGTAVGAFAVAVLGFLLLYYAITGSEYGSTDSGESDEAETAAQ